MKKLIIDNGSFKLIEKIKINRKKPNWLSLIIESYIKFILGEENIDINVEVKLRKIKKTAYIELKRAVLKNEYILNINKDSSLNVMLSFIAHELEHAIQIKKGYLDNDDEYITWKGKKYIKINDYNNLEPSKDFNKYKDLPWEKLARISQKKYPGLYKKSGELEKLAKIDPTINFIVNLGEKKA